MTYATSRPYSFMIEPTVPVLHTDDYSQEDLDRDLQWLGEHGVDVETSLRKWNKYKDNFRQANPSFALLWYVITKAKRADDDDDMGPQWTAPQTYDPAFSRDLMIGLGHEVVDDRHGMIYSSEPEQAVFFTNRSFRVVSADAPTRGPTSNRSRSAARRTGLVSNPPWVDEVISKSWDRIRGEVPEEWLPAGSKAGPLKELGCGHYGCVLPTLDPNVVLKVTTDDTEAEFSDLAYTLVAPICVTYHQTIKLDRKYQDRNVYLLWRDAAHNVGKIGEILGPVADRLIGLQHLAGKKAYTAAAKWPQIVGRMARIWEGACEAMVKQTQVSELHARGAGLVRVGRDQHILSGDLHADNLGVVNGHWVITDPGHIAIVDPKLLIESPLQSGSVMGDVVLEARRLDPPSKRMFEVTTPSGVSVMSRDDAEAMLKTVMPPGFRPGSMLATHMDYAVMRGVPITPSHNTIYLMHPRDLVARPILGTWDAPAVLLGYPLRDSALKEWRDSMKWALMDPIRIQVLPDGRYLVDDAGYGDYVLQVAAERDAPIAVMFDEAMDVPVGMEDITYRIDQAARRPGSTE